MPRDLWYRIVYSQILEQQLGKKKATMEKISFSFNRLSRKWRSIYFSNTIIIEKKI